MSSNFHNINKSQPTNTLTIIQLSSSIQHTQQTHFTRQPKTKKVKWAKKSHKCQLSVFFSKFDHIKNSNPIFSAQVKQFCSSFRCVCFWSGLYNQNLMISKGIKVCTFKESVNLSKRVRILKDGIAQDPIKNQKPLSFNGENQFDIRDIDEKSQQKYQEEQHQGILQDDWTIQQEKILIQLHNQKGNKWVEIARLMHRSDNSVKNHYHSKLRKALRKINKCILDHLKTQCKPFKNNILSKIIQTSQNIHSLERRDTKCQVGLAFKLKNDILAFTELNQQQISVQQISQVRKLVSQICGFNKIYKKQDKATKTNKLTSNKYKGKQIISLISQHSNKKETNLKMTKQDKLIQNTKVKEVKEVSLPKNQKGKDQVALRSEANNFHNNIGMSDFYYLLKQPAYPLFYSFIPNRYSIYSGKISSFTYYTPENNKNSEQMTMWGSMSNLECDLANSQHKSQNEDADLSKI